MICLAIGLSLPFSLVYAAAGSVPRVARPNSDFNSLLLLLNHRNPQTFTAGIFFPGE
jgi:hypothetical protein